MDHAMRRKSDQDLALAMKAFVEGPSVQGKIREDGGDIRFDGIEGRTVRITMTAACADCPASALTVTHFIEPAMRARFGQAFSVEARFKKPYFKA